MANYKWPNVYPNIKDLSGVVATNSVTSCAYVGEAEFGPINKPTLLTSLRDYTSKFGVLNSAKYGYAGYSLAVASESIDSHYFVRVVKAGPNADTGEHEADDAMYASVKIPVKGNTASKGTGWYVEEIDVVEKEQNASGLFTNEKYQVSKVELQASGSGYNVDDELLIVLDPISARVKVDELETEYTVSGVTIVNGGTSYTANDVLTAHFENGTDAQFTVVSVDENGTINTLQINDGGLSDVNITETISLTGGTGYDASVTLSMANTGKIKKISLVDGGESTVGTIENPVNLENSSVYILGTGAKANVTLTNVDLSNGLIFVANNPNNLQLAVRLIDSTINENRAYPFSTVSYQTINEDKYKATVHNVNVNVLDGLEVGDTVVISRSNNSSQEGLFEVTEIDTTTASVSFEYSSSIEPETLNYGKISKYPRPDERTIQVDVILKNGRLTQVVETYQFCTLYQAKDNYGNSMFIEDVINDTSDYVKVYVNPNLISDDEVLQVELNTIETTNLLEGGQSGGKPGSNDLNEGWEQFKDRTQVTVSLLLNSGYTTNSYQNKMIEIAEYRRDCFCLLDIPMSEVEPEDAIDWRKNTLGSTTYRAALSSPWVKTYDSVQGRANFVMCPSAFVAKLIGAAGDPWHAPAGPNRGVISSATVSPTGLTQSYDAVIGGTLYADNQINCIVRDTSAGYVNWGQRTLQAKPSALDRINVARTVIYIETVLRDAARWHLFENNTAFERMQITLQFSQFLDTVLSADGIAAYQVICDTSNNTPIVIANNQLVIDVILTPVYAAESIILNTTITGADASVDITSSAN